MNIQSTSTNEHLYIKQPGSSTTNVIDILTGDNKGKVYIQNIGGYLGTNITAEMEDLATYLANLPEPMVFRGTLGTGGTITALPNAAANTEGDVYKVIEASTYVLNPSTGTQTAKIGDGFICAELPVGSYLWVYVPSGDEPSGTVTNVATGTDLTGGPITTSGTISHAEISHTNTTSSSTLLDGSTFTVIDDITVSATGHVTNINTKSVTLPDDTKVTLTKNNTLNEYRPILGAGTTDPNSATTSVYSTNIAVNPSLNAIKVNESAMYYDTSEKCIKFSFNL